MMYHDPLHVPSAMLVVKHNGKEVLLLNKHLLDKQLAWDNLELILLLHSLRLHLEDEMKATDDPKLLKAMDLEYTQIEFELQDAWGFPRNAKFHAFWNRPKCICPKIDNSDSYPTGFYITRQDCPLHGRD